MSEKEIFIIVAGNFIAAFVIVSAVFIYKRIKRKKLKAFHVKNETDNLF